MLTAFRTFWRKENCILNKKYTIARGFMGFWADRSASFIEKNMKKDVGICCRSDQIWISRDGLFQQDRFFTASTTRGNE